MHPWRACSWNWRKTVLNALLRARWASLWSGLMGGIRGRHRLRTLLFALLMLYSFGAFFAMFFLMFNSLYAPLNQAGLAWLYFSLAGLSAAAVNLIVTVFLAQSQLFAARDNDLLLSMPIPPRAILASRMMLLLGMGYVLQLMVLGPAWAVYCLNSAPSALGAVMFALCFLALPFLPLALSCLFGWLLTAVSSRMRHKSLATVVLSLALLGGYFYVMTRFNSCLSWILLQGRSLAEGIKRVLFPAYCFGTAIAQGSVRGLLGFIACMLLPFGAVYAVLSRHFIKIVTTRRGVKKQEYRARELTVSGAVWAMVQKELKHLVSSPMYLLNGALGALLLVALGVALFLRQDLFALLFENLPDKGGMAGPFAALVLCAMECTVIVSAPSISLEAKTLWMLKSFPVDASQALLSKAYAHMLVAVPAGLFAGIPCCLFLVEGLWMGVLVVMAPVLMGVLCALWGVTANLWFPKFDWLNEVVAIKQGMSTMVSMFGGWALLAAMGLGYGPLAEAMGQEAYLGLCLAVLSALCLGLYRYLVTGGRNRFARLQS